MIHSKRTQDYIDQLEEEIKSSEVIGPALLDEWKRFEKKWLEDVVHMDKHENLVNPYEIKVENREYILRAYERQADRDSIGLSREETMKILTGAGAVGYGEGLVGVIAEAMELQEIK